MIIHSPIISGSLTFAEGASATLPSSTSYSGSFLGTVNATNGIVSGSIQILGGSTVLSSSAQNFTEFSSSVADTFAGLSTDYNDLQNIPSGIISSSGQIDDLFNIDGVISGAAQITPLLPTGTISGSAQLLNVATDFGTGRVSGDNIGDIGGTTTFTGSFVGDGTNLEGVTSYTDSDTLDYINSISVVSGSEQIVDALVSLNTYTASNDTTNSTQNSRLDQLSTETGSITTEQSAQDSRLTQLETKTGSLDSTNTSQNSRLSNLEAETGSITTEQSTQDGRLSNLESFTSSLDTDLATLSLPANTTISSFGKTLVDDADAATARTTLGVDAAGTDNSTDVTLAGSYDYITITGQEITRNQITNDDLAGSIANAKLANSTITINGNSTALGGSYSVTAADVGLGNVTNESKATMFTNAALTGAPTAPTQIGTDDSTKIATTAFVQDRIDTIIGTAGSTLDTLGELSASLSDDQDALTSLTTTVGTKLAKASNLSDLTDASTARTNLGVAIGTDVQAYNATLAAVAGGTYTGDDSITTVGTIGTGTWQGTAIGDSYISSATAWNAKLDSAGTIATNDYAKYDASGDLVGRSYSEVKTDLSLNNVENTAVSTWAGSSNITTLGTITTGTWNGTAIANAYLANSTISGISLGSNLASLSAGTGISLTAYNGSTARTIAATDVYDRFQAVAVSGQTTIYADSNADTLTFAGGTGVTATTNATTDTVTFAIGQSVGTSDTVQFGKVGVGTAADATYELKVSGDIGATGDIVAYISSDERLKDNIELISNPIEKVQSLRGVTWEWNDNASEAAKQSPNVGVIAQDLEKVLPQLVHDRESGYKGVDYAKLTGLLIEAIKEQQKQIDDLKSKLG